MFCHAAMYGLGHDGSQKVGWGGRKGRTVGRLLRDNRAEMGGEWKAEGGVDFRGTAQEVEAD